MRNKESLKNSMRRGVLGHFLHLLTAARNSVQCSTTVQVFMMSMNRTTEMGYRTLQPLWTYTLLLLELFLHFLFTEDIMSFLLAARVLSQIFPGHFPFTGY